MNEISSNKNDLNGEKVTKRPHCKYCGFELTYIVKYCPRCGEELH